MIAQPPRWLWSHCTACAVFDSEEIEPPPLSGWEPGVGCPSDGPGADGCEAVWLDMRGAGDCEGYGTEQPLNADEGPGTDPKPGDT